MPDKIEIPGSILISWNLTQSAVSQKAHPGAPSGTGSPFSPVIFAAIRYFPFFSLKTRGVSARSGQIVLSALTIPRTKSTP